MSQENFLCDRRRSPFSFSIREIAAGTSAGVFAALDLIASLRSNVPYPCNSEFDNPACHWTYETSWTQLGQPIFGICGAPLIIMVSISAIFLVRSIYRNVRHFSLLGNISLSYPLLSFFALQHLSIIFLFLPTLLTSFLYLPLFYFWLGSGILLAIFTLIISISTLTASAKVNWGDFCALPYNIFWAGLYLLFMIAVLGIYGD
ncbi:MAG: hypothetical protein HZB52_02310 [Chloroflexi bacterium]|nr:hypothetical protein [Chloroflexota bacterium]